MNDVIETILNHRSIRKFKDIPLTDEQIKTVVSSAQMASTSSYIQAYTIIGVKNPETKQKLAELAGGQAYVENSGHFFIFCADLQRHELIGKMENTDVSEALQSTEKFMVSVIDAALAAQNATLMTESMGLGICYIGGIRNNIEEVSNLLKLPDYVIPLFGLTVGVPESEGSQKPRLPFENVYHEETYTQSEDKLISQLHEYNETVAEYYRERTDGKRSDTWTGQMAGMLSSAKRKQMMEFVQSKGFMKN